MVLGLYFAFHLYKGDSLHWMSQDIGGEKEVSKLSKGPEGKEVSKLSKGPQGKEVSKLSKGPQGSPINFIIVAGYGETDAVTESIPLINSILLLSSVAVHFYIFSDEKGVKRFDEKIFKMISSVPIHVEVDLHGLDLQRVLELSSKIHFNPYFHHSGVWGAAKLFVPWLLPEVDTATVVDTDMIFVEDPALLFMLFNKDDTVTYKMPLNENKPGGICSCIVLIHMDLARKQQVFPAMFANSLKAYPSWRNPNRTYDCPHGDQGLYFALWKQQPDLMATIPVKWNLDRCHKFYGIFRKRNKREAGLIHRNCNGGNKDAAETYYRFYRDYPFAWHAGQFKVHVTIVPKSEES